MTIRDGGIPENERRYGPAPMDGSWVDFEWGPDKHIRARWVDGRNPAATLSVNGSPTISMDVCTVYHGVSYAGSWSPEGGGLFGVRDDIGWRLSKRGDA